MTHTEPNETGEPNETPVDPSTTGGVSAGRNGVVSARHFTPDPEDPAWCTTCASDEAHDADGGCPIVVRCTKCGREAVHAHETAFEHCEGPFEEIHADGTVTPLEE